MPPQAGNCPVTHDVLTGEYGYGTADLRKNGRAQISRLKGLAGILGSCSAEFDQLIVPPILFSSRSLQTAHISSPTARLKTGDRGEVFLHNVPNPVVSAVPSVRSCYAQLPSTC